MAKVSTGHDRATLVAIGTGANGADCVPVSTANPLPVSSANGLAYTNRSMSLNGSSQQLMAANANRKALIIHNIGATAIGVNLIGGTASLTAAGNINMPAGASLYLTQYPPTSLVNVIGTNAANVTAFEG